MYLVLGRHPHLVLLARLYALRYAECPLLRRVGGSHLQLTAHHSTFNHSCIAIVCSKNHVLQSNYYKEVSTNKIFTFHSLHFFMPTENQFVLPSSVTVTRLVPAAPVPVAHLDDVAGDVGAAVVHGLAPLHLGEVLPPVGDCDLQWFDGILFPNGLSISSTGVKLLIGSKVLCQFCLEICTPEGTKRRECKFQNKAHRTFDRRITLSPLYYYSPPCFNSI